MKNKILIIGGVLILVLVFLLTNGFIGGQEVSKLDPADVVGDFYEQWLRAVKDPVGAIPDLATLATYPILSKTLSASLVTAQADASTTLDPVLCQSRVPDDISIRNVYETDKEVEMLVVSRDKSVTNQAVVKLKSLDGGWYIDDIECSAGEFGPEREFSFERVGYLLKSSVPAPYDSKKWHLIFEENGELGHVAPLIFDSESRCSQGGSESVCRPDQFIETQMVSIRGQMTETGVNVKFQELIK